MDEIKEDRLGMELTHNAVRTLLKRAFFNY